MPSTLTKKILIALSFSLIFISIFYLLNSDIRNFACAICGNKTPQENNIPESWLEKYDLSLENATDSTLDIDNDDLSLIEEYHYATHPKEADTDKDGYNDGTEVAAGYNPTGEGRLDMDKDGLIDSWEKENNLSLTENDYALDPDNDQLPNYLEMRHGTDPNKADTDGDGFGDSSEIRNGYDPSKAGSDRPNHTITIKKINVSAPIVWSGSFSETDLQEDLKKGVIHYPQTGTPGQAGNTVLTGHSSNYIWVEGKYNYIFKNLNDLEKGDEIIITATQANQKILTYTYTVTTKEVVSADDQRIFDEAFGQTLTIATCWPLNTNWKRLMLKAEQNK